MKKQKQIMVKPGEREDETQVVEVNPGTQLENPEAPVKTAPGDSHAQRLVLERGLDQEIPAMDIDDVD